MKNHKGPSISAYASTFRREDLLEIVGELYRVALPPVIIVTKEMKKQKYKKQLSDLLAFSVDKIAK